MRNSIKDLFKAHYDYYNARIDTVLCDVLIVIIAVYAIVRLVVG